MTSQLDIFSGPRLRATSIQAFREIQQTGLIKGKRFEVYSALFNLGRATAGETARALGQGVSRNNVSTRLSELRNMGVIREVDTRPCKISGKRNLVFEVVTGALPRKPAPSPRPARLIDALALAEELIETAVDGSRADIQTQAQRLLAVLREVKKK